MPLYTPEPDVIHEVVGHCNSLANPQFADLYAAAGAASKRVDDETLTRFSKTFWFTLEFGVVWEAGDLKAYGAGLLSSYGEMNAYRNAELRDWDLDAMAATDYDINVYQPALFAAPDFDSVVTDLTAWLQAPIWISASLRREGRQGKPAVSVVDPRWSRRSRGQSMSPDPRTIEQLRSATSAHVMSSSRSSSSPTASPRRRSVWSTTPACG